MFSDYEEQKMRMERSCQSRNGCTGNSGYTEYHLQEVGYLLSRLLVLLENTVQIVDCGKGNVQEKEQSVTPVATPIRMTMNVIEVAQQLNVSPQTVRAMIHRKELPAFRVGRKYGMDRVAFRLWLLQKSQGKWSKDTN